MLRSEFKSRWNVNIYHLSYFSLLLALILFQSCSNNIGRAPYPDLHAELAVANGSIADNASEVSQTPNIVVKFNKKMVATSINNKSVLLFPANNPGHLVELADLLSNASQNLFFIIPKHALTSNTHYVIEITPNILATDNSKLLKPIMFNFTTGDFSIPTVSLISPLIGYSQISTTPLLQLHFSKAVSPINRNIAINMGASKIINYSEAELQIAKFAKDNNLDEMQSKAFKTAFSYNISLI